jgi:hypothetical protein
MTAALVRAPSTIMNPGAAMVRKSVAVIRILTALPLRSGFVLPRHRPFLVLFLAAVLPVCARHDAAEDAAVDTCTSALRASGDEADPTAAGRSVAVACAPLYEERACREGYRRAWDEQTDPSQRIRILVDACSAAYCPKLAEPRPALCAQPSAEHGGFVALSERWQEFQGVVLVRDLGAARAEKVLAAMKEAGAKRAAGAGMER